MLLFRYLIIEVSIIISNTRGQYGNTYITVANLINKPILRLNYLACLISKVSILLSISNNKSRLLYLPVIHDVVTIC